MTILFDGKVRTATAISATNPSLNYPAENIQHPFLAKRFQGSTSSSVITITLAEASTIDCFFYALHNLNALTVVLKRELTWSLQGTPLNISGIGTPSLAALNSTDVAFIDLALKNLSVYRWSGSAWSLVGTPLNISGINSPALAALNSTDVAFIDSVLENLSVYRWSGSTWSLQGTPLNITGIGTPALAALNSTDVAFIDSALENLSVYRWSGSAWSLVGTPLNISGISIPSLAALNSTDVAFIDATLKTLSVYRWSGSAWSLVGTPLNISGSSYPALAALNSTDVAFIDSVLENLSVYRWSGSTWSLQGTPLNITGIGTPALAALNSTDVAFIDSALENLSVYRGEETILDTIIASPINDVGVEYFTAVDDVNTIEITITCASGSVYLGGFEAGDSAYIGRFIASWPLDLNDRSLYWKSRGGQVTSDIAAMLRAYKFQFRELLKADIDTMLTNYQISGASPVFIDVTEDDRDFIAPMYGQIIKVPAGQKTDRRFSTELIIEESK